MSDFTEEQVKSYYTELVKSLRNRRICLQSGGNEDDFGLWIQAADAIEHLQSEVKRLSNTFVIPHEKAVTCEGYPVQELICFANLCRRHEITENDLHDFCTNALRGYEAGKNDFRIVWENSIEQLSKRLPKEGT